MHQVMLISCVFSLFVNASSQVNFPSDENIEIKIPVFFDYNNPKKGKSDISVISTTTDHRVRCVQLQTELFWKRSHCVGLLAKVIKFLAWIPDTQD